MHQIEQTKSSLFVPIAFWNGRAAAVIAAASGVPRLLHIHRNIPGVFWRIDQVFGENNIAAQYLQTNAQIGCVVTNVEAEHSQAALEKLR